MTPHSPLLTPNVPRLVECIPNFSEGQRPEVVAAIREAVAASPGAVVLDVHIDASHHRSVITFVAPPEQIVDAAFAAIRAARDAIDLTAHRGVHPRMGAADVVPFVPLDGVSMDECVALARALGERVGRELEIPVYLYEQAATRPERRNLADVLRGGFETIRDEIATLEARAPDFGPRRVHPTAGAVAIGARHFLVAYNVYLGPVENMPVAREVARAVRASSGGLPGVKALALEVDGQAQLSMNLVDLALTPIGVAYDAVSAEAEKRGVTPTWSEIVGLVPEGALLDVAARHLQLRDFTPDRVLEHRLRTAVAASPSLVDYLDAVASDAPTPGGGSVAAVAGALAGALAEMVARLTAARGRDESHAGEMRELASRGAALRADLMALGRRDEEAYNAVVAAYRAPRDDARRAARIDAALVDAARIPLETMRACAGVAELARAVAERGFARAASDAGSAALLAEAGARSAMLNVRTNLAALSPAVRESAETQELDADSLHLSQVVARTTAAALASVERRLLEQEH